MLAVYSHKIEWDNLIPKTVHEVKRRILDTIGVGIAASNEDTPSAARAYALDLPLANGATLWGSGDKVTPEAAALANGAMVRYLDFNDTYLALEPLHPSDTIPGLIALGEWTEASPKELLTAIAIAYEVGVNLCDSASLRSHGWDHVNYTGIAAACGAGSILKLTPKQLEHALSITLVAHASMRQTRSGELSMWKGAADANSVRNAIFSSHAVLRGMTGPFKPFMGEMGFVSQLLNGDMLNMETLQSLKGDTPSPISDTYIKKWPVEYHAPSGVDATQIIHGNIKDIREIVSVRIDTFKAAYEIIAKDPEKWSPRTRETADHSLQYIVASTLVDGFVSMDSFSPKQIQDPTIKSILEKTDLHEDPELTKGYPNGIPNRATVNTTDGRNFSSLVEFPSGHVKNPMTDQELEDKFKGNVGRYFSRDQISLVTNLIWNLEEEQTLERLRDR